MKPQHWIIGAALLGSTLAAPAAGPKALAGRKPNIILILTDDQGFGDLGRNGNPVLQTPNLDRMHDESRRFTDFHVSPTCSPTRSAIMTGRHEFKNGITHTIFERERLTLKATTIAQVLQAAGYTTGIFGKWHLGDEAPYQPGKRGFDEVFIHGAGGIGQSYEGSCGDAPGNSYFDPVIRHNGTFEKTKGYCTDVFFAEALRWIGSARGGKPFFAYIPTNAPHAPLDVRPEDEARYAGKVKDPKAAKFFGMIANIDDNVGRLLAKLSEWGIERDTLVVFMNDNGGTAGVKIFNAGMKGTKGTAHNGGTRGMSLWRWPGTLEPGDIAALTAHFDLFPTFAALAGATLPADAAPKRDGLSLLPLLADPKAPWPADRMLFTHVGRWQPGAEPAPFGGVKGAPCSVRWRNYLMVRQAPGWTLFDLAADPGETKDLAAAQADVVRRLDAAYSAWWAEILPCLENERAFENAPKLNPFKELYWKQYRGAGPNNVPPPQDLAL